MVIKVGTRTSETPVFDVPVNRDNNAVFAIARCNSFIEPLKIKNNALAMINVLIISTIYLFFLSRDLCSFTRYATILLTTSNGIGLPSGNWIVPLESVYDDNSFRNASIAEGPG